MSYDKCPYCAMPVEICHDDGYGMSEDETHQQECGKCGKSFAYTTCIEISHEIKAADCLNGGNHKWKATITVPVSWTRMKCEDCGEERPLTAAERKDLKAADPEMGPLEKAVTRHFI